ncbi:MAG: hypothetical protein MUF72_10780 [Elainella sp. Prado103]|nr:hypothetical protein [Elainella sp. Prado103]
MARKRLSDLLREEGQKPEKSPDLPTDLPSADSAQDTDPIEPVIAVEAELLEPPATPVADFVDDLRQATEPEGADLSSSDRADLSQSTRIAELEHQLTELAHQLADAQSALVAQKRTAQNKEADLQELIANLEAKIAHQAEEMQQWQAELQAEAAQAKQTAKQLQAELEDARQTILQLSQANAKPTPRVIESPRAAEPELEPSKHQLVLPSRPIGTPRPASPSFPSQPAASQPVPASDRPPVHQLALRKMLDHPTQPGSLPPMPSEPRPPQPETVKLTETDVGWMD